MLLDDGRTPQFTEQLWLSWDKEARLESAA